TRRHGCSRSGRPRRPGILDLAESVRSGRSAGVRWSLRVKAMAGVTLLVVVTSAVIGVAVLRVMRSSIHRAFETHIDLVLDDVAHGASMLLLPPCDRDEIFRNLRDAVKVDGV